MSAVLGVVLFAVGVAGSIALHEVGHLLPAKRFGVKVTQYMVGFGPTLWARRRGETEYGVKAVPLGGYIRMIGMYPPARPGATRSRGFLGAMIDDARRASAEEIGPGDETRAFYRLTVPRRLVVMLGGPTMNLVLAVLFFALAMAALGIPQYTAKVSAVTPCVASAVSASGEPTCNAGDPASPAAAAGLAAGDTIVAFNGAPVTSWDQLTTEIRAAGGEQVTLAVRAPDGTERDVTVDVVTTSRPDLTDPSKTVQAGYLGVAPSLEQVRMPLTAVPGRIWQITWGSAKAVLSLPEKLVGVWQAAFGGQQRDLQGPVSLVGVGRVSAQVVDAQATPAWKASNFLVLMGGLNLALFLFNLIPLLPLDGGHVAGALYEGARRRLARLAHRPDPGPVDLARMLPLAYTVATLLIGMSLLLIYADIVAPIRLNG